MWEPALSVAFVLPEAAHVAAASLRAPLPLQGAGGLSLGLHARAGLSSLTHGSLPVWPLGASAVGGGSGAGGGTGGGAPSLAPLEPGSSSLAQQVGSLGNSALSNTRKATKSASFVPGLRHGAVQSCQAALQPTKRWGGLCKRASAVQVGSVMPHSSAAFLLGPGTAADPESALLLDTNIQVRAGPFRRICGLPM